MAYGGVQWENQSRSAWNLRKSQEEGSNFADLILSHQKVNGGPLSLPITVRFEFPDENDTNQQIAIGLVNSPDMARSRDTSPKLWDRVREALKNRPMTLEALAEELDDVPGQELRKVVTYMENKGLQRSVRLVDGKMTEFWGLRTNANG